VGRAGGKLAAQLGEIAAGRSAVPEPRDAATVVVIRPAGDGPAGNGQAAAGPGLEALMLRRTAAMKFAPGAYVFPGGSVDQGDYSADIGWHGPSPAEFGARLGAPAEVARALVCAAVRETFEESGLLLAGAPGGGPLTGLAERSEPPSWAADRLALASGVLSLAELLNRRGLVVRADLLVPWARWITPEGEPRRFDARFFVAAAPDGQVASGHAAESDHIAWLAPAAAISAAKAGEISLLPPTATTLNDLASAVAAGSGMTGVLGARRPIEPGQPRLVLEDDTAWLVLPDAVGYPL
jgi:8-oxo-dGTP pyrophosphatase MutT (NUDIX family)